MKLNDELYQKQQDIIKIIKEAVKDIPDEQRTTFLWSIGGTVDDLITENLVIKMKDTFGALGLDMDRLHETKEKRKQEGN